MIYKNEGYYFSPSRVIIVRCFSYNTRNPYWGRDTENGDHIAECIDLNLRVMGYSNEDAYKGLQRAMNAYMAKIDQKGEVGSNKEILCPSPLSHRVHYHWNKLRSKISHMIFGDLFWDPR